MIKAKTIMNEMKVKPMSLRSPEEIRQELASEWAWNIAAMATNYRRSLSEMAGLLQHGGETYRESQKKETAGPALVRASYDVTFSPATNVRVEVIDPHHPTDTEIAQIMELAVSNILYDMGEEDLAENVSSVTLHSVNDVEVKSPKPLWPEDIDPEILVELTALAYKDLYAILNDGAWVSNELRQEAMRLTKKYWETDWDQTDFWITMEEEAQAFIEKTRSDQSTF